MFEFKQSNYRLPQTLRWLAALACVLATDLVTVQGQGFQGYGGLPAVTRVAQRPVGSQRASVQPAAGLAVGNRPILGQQPISFPYKVRARVGGAAVRSGPGASFYQTTQLKTGAVVEVYRHDSGGWFAIRPPKDEFSLVRSTDLIGTSVSGEFRVTRPGAKAWIGTRINQQHQPISQVKLKLDEVVSVISTLSADRNGQSEAWYQIDPPSGEFRWVHSSQLDIRRQDPGRNIGTKSGLLTKQGVSLGSGMRPAPPVLVGNPAALPRTLDRLSPGTIVPSQLSNGGSVLPESAVAKVAADMTDAVDSQVGQWQAAKQSKPELLYDHSSIAESKEDSSMLRGSPNGEMSPASIKTVDYEQQSKVTAAGQNWDSAVSRLRQAKGGHFQASNLSADGQLLDSKAPVTATIDGSGSPISHLAPGVRSIDASPRIFPERTPATGSAPGDWGKQDWDQRLAMVEVLLNREVVNAPAQWKLRPLLQASAQLRQSANTSGQRAKVDLLQKRINNFMLLQQRKPDPNDRTADLGGLRLASRDGFAFGATAPPVRPVAKVKQHPYDAVGFLKEMVLDRGRSPSTYVLQDESGRTICHVMGKVGVNVRMYLDKKIGVTGQKGYHNRLRLPHVTIEKIVPLNGRN